jgi:hypothetical protein
VKEIEREIQRQSLTEELRQIRARIKQERRDAEALLERLTREEWRIMARLADLSASEGPDEPSGHAR